MAGVPETAVAAVRRYCDDKVPPEHRHDLRVECSVRGTTITIHESRPPWRPERGPVWTQQPIAQLRFDGAVGKWHLFCVDSKSRWHRYDVDDATGTVEDLLAEIDDDPTGIFWG